MIKMLLIKFINAFTLGLVLGQLLIFNSIANDEIQDVQTHTIQSGEELMTISYKYYGTHQKWREILEANPDLDPKLLSMGTVIKIPKLEGIVTAAPKQIYEPEITSSVEKTEVEAEVEEIVEVVVNKEPSEIVIPVNEVISEKNHDLDKLKNEYAKLLEELKDSKRENNKLAKENEALRQLNQDGQDKVIDRLNLKDNLDKTREEYSDLNDEYLKLKERNIHLEQEVKAVDFLRKKYSRAEDKLKDYEQDISDLTKKLSNFENEAKKRMEDHPFYLKAQMASDQMEVLKEKNRILTEKLWLEKNKDFGKCVVKLEQSEQDDTKIAYRDFILFLNENFGTENVIYSQGEDKLIFKIPGKVVYGVNSPNINSRYNKLLVDLDRYLKKLPVKQMNIVGHSKYFTVQDNKKKSHDGELFILGQSITLQSHFVDELGWNPASIYSTSAGYSPDSKGKAQKEFEFRVQFNKNLNTGRAIAQKLNDDKVLKNIGDEILSVLSEPKFSKVEISKNSVDINLGRHYFFSKKPLALTSTGKQKIDKIVEMFSSSSDVSFDLVWVPGKRDKNEIENVEVSIKEIELMKKYLEQRHAWIIPKINFGFANRHHTITDGLDYHQDKFNDRLIFKVVPKSINLRQMDELDGV